MSEIVFSIVIPGKDDYLEIVEVWEASVRATHDFLTERDIARLKPLVLEKYLDAVDLRCVKDANGRIVGFIGTHDERIEMLFIDPDYRGKSVGKFLTRHAVDELGMKKVDVNEQNAQAVGFYEHMGFEIIGRSPLDGQGQPFPLLHLKMPG
ncbi:MAG: acetyltransferase [Woeseiaceae bacterium]|nr:acetyltransferase [Woeseiaceae bacterium]